MQIRVIDTVEEARAINEDVATLFRTCFNRELDRRRWAQYYFLNPYGAPLVALSYNDDGVLVGHSGMIPQRLLASDGTGYDYCLSISLMVDPQHREGFKTFYDLFTAATNAARDRGVPFLLAFPNANSYLLLKHGFAWRDLVDTRLYDWQPDQTLCQSGPRVPLERFRLGDEIGHPYDATYREWRSHACPYHAELVNDRMAIIYKLLDDGILTVLDVQTTRPEHAADDLGTLVAATGAAKLRMSGVHAQALGFDLATLTRHGDYRLRLCYTPLITDPPPLRFSLLLSDVF